MVNGSRLGALGLGSWIVFGSGSLGCSSSGPVPEAGRDAPAATRTTLDEASAYRHPLLQASARTRIADYFRAHPRTNAQSFLRDHVIVNGVRATGEGSAAVTLDGVVPAQRQAVPGFTPSPEPSVPALSLSADVQRWVDHVETRPKGLVALSLALRRGGSSHISVPHQLRLAMIEGRLTTHADARRLRAEAVLAHRQAGEAALAPLRSRVSALAGRVLSAVPSAGTLDIELPIAKLDALLATPGLSRVETTGKSVENAGYEYAVDGTSIDGRELEDLLQTTQYYDRGYEGLPDERITVVEGGAPDVFNDHQGFDGRYDNCGDDGAGACDFAHPTNGTQHATALASVLLGDITGGQDPAINGPRNRRKRSGVARQALGRGISDADLGFLSDRLFAYGDSFIVTHSASATANDPDCRGDTAYSRDWNALYEDGYAIFNSTGNNGHSDPHDCTAAAPSTAIGVFGVGAYNIDSNDNEALYSGTDQGGDGTVQQGRHRTIVGLLGPSGMEYAYPHLAWPVDAGGNEFQYGTEWPSGPGPSNFCCTSSSTPVVAGSAALFRQWFRDVHGSAIDDPGLLYTNLLLMGDRTNDTREILVPLEYRYQNVGFNGLWGAGRLRLRLFDLDGLDNPASWATGSVCVDDGTDNFIDMGSMNDDVDIVNTVIWWYDRRHDDGVHHDNIDLAVQRDAGGGAFATVLSSATQDNRERVTLERPQAGSYRMQLTGQRVTAVDEGCGPNSMLVYWAYVAEDNDRESFENLAAVRPYPLNLTVPDPIEMHATLP